MTRRVARRWLRPWSLALAHWAIVFPCLVLDHLGQAIRDAARETRAGIRSYDFEEG